MIGASWVLGQKRSSSDDIGRAYVKGFDSPMHDLVGAVGTKKAAESDPAAFFNRPSLDCAGAFGDVEHVRAGG